MIHAPGVAALQPLGPARRGHRHRLPADRDLLVRLRAVHDHRHAAAVRRHLDRVRAAAHGARQDPRRRRRRTPAPRCASGSPSTRSSSRTASVVGIRGHGEDGDTVRRAGPRRDRRRRTQLAASPRRSGPSSTTRSRCSSGATTRTGATCRSTASRSSSVPIAAGPRCRPTTA